MVIYKIVINDEIVYIGKTKCFHNRCRQHKEAVMNWIEKGEAPKKMQKLYEGIKNAMLNGKDVTMEVLVDTDQMLTNHVISNSELSAMELAFIQYFKPRLNYEGIKGPYIFPYERYMMSKIPKEVEYGED